MLLREGASRRPRTRLQPKPFPRFARLQERRLLGRKILLLPKVQVTFRTPPFRREGEASQCLVGAVRIQRCE